MLAQNYSTTDKARLLTDVVDDITVDTGLDLDGLRAVFNATALIGGENFGALDLTATLSEAVIDGNSVLVADPQVRPDPGREPLGRYTEQIPGSPFLNSQTADPVDVSLLRREPPTIPG